MSATLDLILSKVGELSSEELLALQERIVEKLGQSKPANGHPKQEIIYAPILTPEEIEAELIEIFGAVEYAQIKAAIANGILDNLPQAPRPISQEISEDREDRV